MPIAVARQERWPAPGPSTRNRAVTAAAAQYSLWLIACSCSNTIFFTRQLERLNFPEEKDLKPLTKV
ncbi:hypothetical protein A0H81_14342 [Grifola frondosa]|uniref:Uncharacterized protein n=1 Tax=Grifola frondosa TaxID=5627 RepID=A0A1C7LNV1_GRIFR|nr:hypothetical protein A0H81_14342 [Grifola frondosa]